jgi:hypothetical protein
MTVKTAIRLTKRSNSTICKMLAKGQIKGIKHKEGTKGRWEITATKEELIEAVNKHMRRAPRPGVRRTSASKANEKLNLVVKIAQLNAEDRRLVSRLLDADRETLKVLVDLL